MRLLGHGELKAKLAFEVTGASASAIKAVEAKGGTVTLKSITGREKPAADKIKADKRPQARGQGRQRAARKPRPRRGRRRPPRLKPRPRKPPSEARVEGEAKEPKDKPAKKDKSE